MKTLKIARPLILMVAGLPGSGKTYFADQFAETFGIANISISHLKKELPGVDNKKLANLQSYILQQVAKSHASILLDGGCNSRAERQKINKFAKDNDFETLVVWVQTNPAMAKSRSKNLSNEQFEGEASSFTAPQAEREQYVVLSGMHAYSTQAKMVLRKLAGDHTEKAKNSVQPPPQRPQPAHATSTRRGIVIR